MALCSGCLGYLSGAGRDAYCLRMPWLRRPRSLDARRSQVPNVNSSLSATPQKKETVLAKRWSDIKPPCVDPFVKQPWEQHWGKLKLIMRIRTFPVRVPSTGIHNSQKIVDLVSRRQRSCRPSSVCLSKLCRS